MVRGVLATMPSWGASDYSQVIVDGVILNLPFYHKANFWIWKEHDSWEATALESACL